MNAEKLNPFIDAIDMLFHFFILNLVFLITCLPVFTIGTALSSMYYVVIKETKGEYGYVVRTYLREFKRNFKNGTIAFLLLSAVGIVLLFNLMFWPVQGNRFSSVVTGVLAVLAVIWLIVSHYTYPLIGRFVNTPLNSIKNAWGLALRNIKKTLLLLLLDAAIVGFYLFFPLKIILMVVPAFGFVLPVYWRSQILIKVFAPYEEQEAICKNSMDSTVTM